MNVVLISGEYPTTGAGGIGSVAREIREGLLSQDVPNQVICAGDSGSDDDNIVSMSERGRAIASVLDFGWSFHRFVERTDEKDTIYHFHLPAAVGPLLLCPEKILSRAVITFHTTAAGFRRYLYRRVPYQQLSVRGKVYKAGYAAVHEHLERRALGRVAQEGIITTVSSGVRQEVEEWYDVTVSRVIQNGVDAERFDGHDSKRKDDPDTAHILAVGRLVPQKGFCDGLKSLASISSQYSLTVVGTGTMMDKLRNRSDKLGVTAEFEGYVSESRLEQLYRQADVQLMPSLYEGLPMVGLEAAGYGTAIAATNRARVADFVCEHNKDLIVPDRDNEQMAETLSTLLNDPSTTDKIGRENSRRVQADFTSEQMTDQYLSLYRDIQ